MAAPFTVYLVGMRDGVARACRVAWSFGCERVVLVGSVDPSPRFLFSARSLVFERADRLPADVLVLETTGRITLDQVTWEDVTGVAVGGAGVSLPRRSPSARIVARAPCLIGDQALAAALCVRSMRVA